MSMNIGYWNCASGVLKKFNTIKGLITEKNLEAFFVSESDFLFGKDLSAFQIEGMTLNHSATLEARGKTRISCWFKDCFVNLTELQEFGNEIIVLKHVSQNYLAVGIYQPFKLYQNETLRSNLTRLLQNLSRVYEANSRIVIVGDFNVQFDSLLPCPLKILLDEWSSSLNLDQIVQHKTRARLVQGTLQNSMLDLVFTNLLPLEISQDFNALSDHEVIFIRSTTNVKCTSVKEVRYVDWRKYSIPKARELFLGHLNEVDARIRDSEQANELITTALCLTLNKLAPVRKAKLYGSNSVINPKINQLKNKKSRLYKKWSLNKTSENFIALKNVSRDLNMNIKLERKKQLAGKLNGDSKTYWQAINTLMGKNQDAKLKLEINGSQTSDAFIVANAFSDYFFDKIAILNERSMPENFIIPNLFPDYGVNQENFFTPDEVCKAIDKLKYSKSHGHDSIPGCLVKDLRNLLSVPLCWLFNIILTTGEVPKAWKISRIKPLFKKGDRSQVKNYRPISNISTISKVFEKCMVNKLETMFEFDKLMGEHQFAYRSGHSTTLACINLHDFLATNLDSKLRVAMYSTDLSAAFDLLRPALLVKTLLELGVPNLYVRVIENFLTDRFAYVEVENTASYFQKILIGCVQGSVLGPYLFNIYTRELPFVVGANNPDVFSMAYADDAYVCLAYEPENEHQSLKTFENIFKRHSEWLESLGMVLNYDKTEFIVFGNNNRELKSTLGGQEYISNSSVKVLGITFEAMLKWGVHVSKTLAKLNSKSYSLRMLNRALPRNLHKQVLISHFFSHISYGLSLWGANVNSRDSSRLDTAIFKALRLHCFDYARTMSNRELCNVSITLK